MDGQSEVSAGGFLKTIPIIRDFSLNPSCSHGPTILFERGTERFFACSAYRSRKLCPFYLPEVKWKVPGKAARNVNELATSRKRSSDINDYNEESKRKKNESEHPLNTPTQRDKGEAQYHFNQTTVDFFMEQINRLGIDSVLCVGTPSLHDHISKLGTKKPGKNKKILKSFLLDIDQRFMNQYEDNFALYNMCNHHFFQDSMKYKDFLLNSNKLAVFVDPPFGVKVELIWHGCLMGVNKDLMKSQNSSPVSSEELANAEINCDIFWIFPYFMEGHILKCSNSRLQMSDFHVEYRNHAKYKDSDTKSKSSPIRIFTNVPLKELTLPEKDYRFCDLCSKWVDKRNLHCKHCATCTTKDGGGSYVHCKKCERCVKPSWRHCSKCRSCHLAGSTCKSFD